MKTITYNPETHVLVPREPSEEMLQAALRANMRHVIDCINDPTKSKDIGSEETCKQTYRSRYASMIAAAPQPEQVESEPVIIEEPNYHFEAMGCGLEDRNITDRYEAMQYGWDCAISRMFEQIPDEPLYTTPQHDRVAELESETTKLKLDLLTSYGEAEELSGKVAELEKALRVAREALDNCAADYLHADSVLTDSALAKINEVLHD